MSTIKGTVYRIKEGVDLNKFGERDYEILPSENPILIKVIPQDIDGELCQGTLNNIYNNGEWRAKIYAKHKDTISQALDLTYKRGKAVLTDKFKRVLTDWRIQIEPFTDGWIGFASMDVFDKNVYYASNILEKYCAGEIKALLDADMIELIPVEQEKEDENK
nr:MAG TPA: hypothetical protein [Caudoviricetes sp.]